MKVFMKIFNILFCLVFIVFAGLQYNDPDPYVWMPIYLYAAVLCALAARKQYYRGAYLAGVFVYLAYAVYLFFDKYGVMDWAVHHHAENIAETMKATKPWIEETREFFGLFILIIVLVIDYTYASQRSLKKQRKQMMKITKR
ncbi:MAG TPA: transmembrane 220 family protein [Chitinophaga sp.]|uniref:transmembrane 220 family protein n=1 Tax=Chitinophaga sp. TaxID=1869181 RepID=UPI002F94A632